MSNAVSSSTPPALRSALAALRDAGVEYCLLRPLPRWDRGESGDIDLLVASGTLDRAEAAAVNVGYSSVPGRRHGRHLLLYDPDLSGWLWLHLVDELSFGPRYRLQTLAEEACLARAVEEEGIRWLHPGDEFWITLLHCLLDKGAIPDRHRPRLQRLVTVARADDPVAIRLAPVCPATCPPEGVLAAARDGDWLGLERLSPLLLERWPRLAPSRPMPGPVARLRGAVQFRLRDVRRGGIGVALVGPDGAGKTTAAAGIAAGFVFPVRRVYMGLTGGMMRRVNRLRVPGIVLLGRLAVVWSRYLYARSLQARGVIVVFDRYVYDAVAPTPTPLSRAGRVSRWIVGHACPAPDLVLVLSAPGQVMHQRKGAYTAEDLEDWRQHFLGLQHRMPNVEVVDTSRPVDVVRADVIQRVWQCYRQRWR